MTKQELYELNLKEIAEAESYRPSAKEKLEQNLIKLNMDRDKELSLFVIDNIAMNEDLLKTMSVEHSLTPDTENVEWIGFDNSKVVLSKADFGILLKKGVDKVKEIYFRYRKFKDDAIQR